MANFRHRHADSSTELATVCARGLATAFAKAWTELAAKASQKVIAIDLSALTADE